MKKLFALIFVLASLTFGQGGSGFTTVPFSVPPPTGVNQTFSFNTGATGQQQFFYWVVTNYPIGQVAPFGPVFVSNAANALSVSNFPTITWNAPAPISGLTYDVLRSTTATFPGTCAACAVATGITTPLSQTDQGGGLGSYTFVGVSTTNMSFVINNRDKTTPFVSLLDGSQNVVAQYVTTPNGVNGVLITPGTTGNNATISTGVTGADTNAGLTLATQGTGSFLFKTQNGVRTQFSIINTPGAVVNFLQATGNTTGNPPQLIAAGTDTNINTQIIPKGTGDVEVLNATLVNGISLQAKGTGVAPLISPNVAGSDANASLALSSNGTGSVNVQTGAGARQQFQVIDTAGTIINNLTATGAATGSAPILGINASGSDTNTPITIAAKGTGNFNVQQTTNTGPGLSVVGVASAVNGLNILPGATGTAPKLSSAVTGADANSAIAVSSNGTGAVNFQTGNGARTQFQVTDTAGTIVNNIQATGAATGTAPKLTATGTDAAVAMNLATKSTGVVQVNGVQVLDSFGTLNNGISGESPAYSVYGNATVAQINAGLTIVPVNANRTIKLLAVLMQALGGAAATCTAVQFADTAGTPVVGVSVAIAGLTQNTVVTEATATNVTLTTFLTALTAGQGLQIIKTGANCATMTSMNYRVIYTYQ